MRTEVLAEAAIARFILLVRLSAGLSFFELISPLLVLVYVACKQE